MFIIFLGIIPLLSIIAFITYYTRNNLKFSCQKSPLTYVLASMCQGISCACKGVGKQKTVPTLSERVSKKPSSSIRNLEIKPTGLISTTNREAINNSSNIINNSIDTNDINIIEPKRRLSFKNIRGLKFNTNFRLSKNKIESLESDTVLISTNKISPPQNNLNKENNSSEVNLIEPKRRMSFKNIKGLKLNTNFKLSKSKTESPDVKCATPGTTETICSANEFPTISVKNLAKQFNSCSSSSNC